jgi:hypothetical protein
VGIVEYAIVAIKVQPKDVVDIHADWTKTYAVSDVMKQLTKMDPEFLDELQQALYDHLWSENGVITRENQAQYESEGLCGTGT